MNMQMNLIIDNNLEASDYLKLVDSIGWKALTEEQVERALKHTMHTVRAIVDNEAVGMARLVGDFGAHGLLTDVVVLPRYQRRGIGSALVNDVLKYINEYTKKDEKFIIELCPTYGMKEFYQRLGFKYKPENMDGMYLWIEK